MVQSAPRGSTDRSEAAAYIADLAGELSSIARRHGLNTLGYLLEMAKLEAENAKNMNAPSAGSN